VKAQRAGGEYDHPPSPSTQASPHHPESTHRTAHLARPHVQALFGTVVRLNKDAPPCPGLTLNPQSLDCKVATGRAHAPDCPPLEARVPVRVRCDGGGSQARDERRGESGERGGRTQVGWEQLHACARPASEERGP